MDLYYGGKNCGGCISGGGGNSTREYHQVHKVRSGIQKVYVWGGNGQFMGGVGLSCARGICF